MGVQRKPLISRVTGQREALPTKIAELHELTAGIHPGYRGVSLEPGVKKREAPLKAAVKKTGGRSRSTNTASLPVLGDARNPGPGIGRCSYRINTLPSISAYLFLGQTGVPPASVVLVGRYRAYRIVPTNKSMMSDQTTLLLSIFYRRQTTLSSEQSREMSSILNPNLPRYELNGKISTDEQFGCFLQT